MGARLSIVQVLSESARIERWLYADQVARHSVVANETPSRHTKKDNRSPVPHLAWKEQREERDSNRQSDLR